MVGTAQSLVFAGGQATGVGVVAHGAQVAGNFNFGSGSQDNRGTAAVASTTTVRYDNSGDWNHQYEPASTYAIGVTGAPATAVFGNAHGGATIVGIGNHSPSVQQRPVHVAVIVGATLAAVGAITGIVFLVKYIRRHHKRPISTAHAAAASS